jgi:hypothetical protein
MSSMMMTDATHDKDAKYPWIGASSTALPRSAAALVSRLSRFCVTSDMRASRAS